MTDRWIAFTVTLESEMREDDAEAVMNALRMVRGVAQVVPVVADVHAHWALGTARRELGEKLLGGALPKGGPMTGGGLLDVEFIREIRRYSSDWQMRAIAGLASREVVGVTYEGRVWARKHGLSRCSTVEEEQAWLSVTTGVTGWPFERLARC